MSRPNDVQTAHPVKLGIAESTPGPAAINCATFVGFRQAGFIGSLIATLGMVLPSFVIIYVISMFLNNFLEIAWIANAFKGIKIAVSESTPGPIMVNLAICIGGNQGGLSGAIIATFAVVLPSFIIILLVMAILKKALTNKYVQAVLRGLKPCIIGIILATGVYMTVSHAIVDIRAGFLTVVLAAMMFGSKPVMKKKISPVLLIVLSACMGMAVYGAVL